jgi:hypothetical protein
VQAVLLPCYHIPCYSCALPRSVFTFNPHGAYLRRTSDWFTLGYTALALLFGLAQGILTTKGAGWFALPGWVESRSQPACKGEATPGEQASDELVANKM